MWTCKKCGEQIEDQFDSCWKCAGEAEWIGLPLDAVIKRSKRQILIGILFAAALIPVTWFFFGPMAGRGDTYAFGVTFFLLVSGDDSLPGDLMWGHYAIKFLPRRFAAALVLWFISVFVILKVVRRLVNPKSAIVSLSS